MKKKTGIILSLVLISVLLVNAVLAASPGTSGDPLVSKSYVDDKFNQLLALLSTGSAELPVITSSPQQAEASGVSYVPVSANAGQILVGGEGTEIILRSGKGLGYCVGENGLSDITEGKEIFNGDEIYANHLLIVPRDDGRGVVIVEDAWFIVRGSYTLR